MQTRKGVFETNSSSSHSVVIEDGIDFIVPENLEEEIKICGGEYGWDEETFSSWRDKMSYAYTYAKNYGLSEDLENLKEVIEEYTKKKVVFDKTGSQYYTDGYIDHQSIEEAEKIFASKETIKKFIFASASYFMTDNDNH